MNELFITCIKTKDCPIVGDIQIPLSEEKRKHLIITGKNGSGKTTFLRELNKRFIELLNNEAPMSILKNNITSYEQYIQRYETELKILESNPNKKVAKQSQVEGMKQQINEHNNYIEYAKKTMKELQKAQISFNNTDYSSIIAKEKFILLFFEAHRKNNPYIPKAIENIDLKIDKSTNAKLYDKFISYLVRLRTSYLNAKDKWERENNIESKEKAEKIDQWFRNFESTLKKLFERNDLKLDYDDEHLNYKIVYENRNFGFDTLSDGYSSLIMILAELILRMESSGFKAYDMQGIVLIDEIEIHLHISLQKNVLPFLCEFFPNIQFIVTTHSPFVLSSLENAVICDLEYKIITSDLSAYSYDALVEGYFDNDKYSQNIKDKISKYEELCKKDSLTKKEQQQKQELSNYLKKAPTFNAKELESKLNFIELINLSKGG